MKPLGYLFSLPASLFSDFRCASEDSTKNDEQNSAGLNSQSIANSEHASSRGEEDEFNAEEPRLPDPTCNTCSEDAIQLGSREEQREHFKSDWHRYNLRRRLHGKAPIEESTFEALLDNDRDEISSISGSDSEEESAAGQSQGLRTSAVGAQIVFETSEMRFALWKVLLGQDVRAATPQQLKDRISALREDAGIWCVLLSRGGHFAGAIFECNKSTPHNKANPDVDPANLFKIVAHKTFRRYVVRAKAGGKQSGKDATGKYAKSAGSQIRRQNEAALEKEISETLLAWKPHFKSVSRIFISAPGSNELQLYKLAEPVFAKTDARIAKVPFMTGRPTLSEAKRVVVQLLTVYEPGLVIEPPKAKEVQQPAKKTEPSPAEEEKKIKMKEPPKPAEPLLHQAARRGDAAAVTQLLQEGHDPTVSIGKTAYAVATEKTVRDAFRRHMAAAPVQWDWAAAGVPSALTAEMEAEQQQKEAAKKEKLREKEKERKKKAAERKKREKEEAAAKAQEEVAAAAASAAAQSKEGGGVVKKVQKSEQELAKRREMMAAAAEQRIAALKLASQQQALW